MQPALLKVWQAQYPSSTQRIKHLDETLSNHIIGSYAPERPFLDRTSKVFSIGSCFAEEITKSLTRHEIPVESFFMSERWSSAFALKHMFNHLITGAPFPEGFLQDDSLMSLANEKLIAELARSDLFVLTLGLSCCWFKRDDNRMTLEPQKAYGPKGFLAALDHYEMRQTSVEDNEAAILDVIKFIRMVNPKCTIVLTLSPVPLLAAFTDCPPVAANIISKAILRGALHNVISRQLPNVRYWPSYEIITWYGSSVEIIWGKGENDLRHISQSAIDMITALFLEYYFKSLTG